MKQGVLLVSEEIFSSVDVMCSEIIAQGYGRSKMCVRKLRTFGEAVFSHGGKTGAV